MTEYRIFELAKVSGVTERNIRAYRERGLLDPPRRRGREAYYDERHVGQLEAINQLLAKGFTSAHIAAFSEGIRRGDGLTDVLGVQPSWAEPPVVVDTLGSAAQRLVRYGLARPFNGRVAVTDAVLANAIRTADDPEFYLRVVAEVLDSTHQLIAGVAVQAAAAVRTGSQFRPGMGGSDDVVKRVVAGRLRAALEEHLAAPQAWARAAGGF